jgi:hypothetical protein
MERFVTLFSIFKRRTLNRKLNTHLYKTLTRPIGLFVAQAVSRWLPTAAARGRNPGSMWGLGGQNGTGADFLRVLRFTLPIIPAISPSS